jgi:nitrate reductase assembly molybdenum cofactor insertion protein NarJ
VIFYLQERELFHKFSKTAYRELLKIIAPIIPNLKLILEMNKPYVTLFLKLLQTISSISE